MMDDPGPPDAADPAAPPFQVGEWIVEPAWNRIRKGGATVKLEPRVMRLLETLAAEPGQPLARQRLLETVWPNLLVNEEALSRAVSQLRRAFEDSSRRPRYIATVHKGGYSLIAPVRDPTNALTPEPRPARSPLMVGQLFMAVAAAAVCLVLVGVLFLNRGDGPARSAVRTLTPLTSNPGREIDPAISRDGQQVAYLASTDQGYDIFVQAIQGGPPVRITNSALAKGHPVWSPNGRQIAFVAAHDHAAAIYLTSIDRRVTVKLLDLPSWSFGLDWSPDGKSLAYSESGPGGASTIVLFDLASRSQRILPTAPQTTASFKPVFSPDGRHIAFIQVSPGDRQDLVIAPVDGRGRTRTLRPVHQDLHGLDWDADGRALVYSARAQRAHGLWRLAVDGRSGVEAIASQGGDLFNPAISATGRLVVEEVEHDQDLWVADLRSGATQQLIRSTSGDYAPAISADGSQLAFVSDRTGHSEIWVQPMGEQSEPRRVTQLARSSLKALSWSADGKQLAFSAGPVDTAGVYLIDVGGGEPVRVGDGNLSPLGWPLAPSGLLVLKPGRTYWTLHLIDLSTRAMRAVSQMELRSAALARERLSVFAISADGRKLLRISVATGAVEQFRLPAQVTGRVTIHPASDHLYLVEEWPGSVRIYRADLASERFTLVPSPAYFGGGGAVVTPDDASIIYTRHRETANDLAWMVL